MHSKVTSFKHPQGVKYFSLCIQKHVFNMNFENVWEKHSSIPLQACAKHQIPLLLRSIVCFTIKVYMHIHGYRLAHLGKYCYSICMVYVDPFWPGTQGSQLHIWVLEGIFVMSKHSAHSAICTTLEIVRVGKGFVLLFFWWDMKVFGKVVVETGSCHGRQFAWYSLYSLDLP